MQTHKRKKICSTIRGRETRTVISVCSSQTCSDWLCGNWVFFFDWPLTFHQEKNHTSAAEEESSPLSHRAAFLPDRWADCSCFLRSNMTCYCHYLIFPLSHHLLTRWNGLIPLPFPSVRLSGIQTCPLFLCPSSHASSFFTVPSILHAAGTEVVKVTWWGYKRFSLNHRYCNGIQSHCTLHSVLCNILLVFTLICPTALFAFHISTQSCISFLSNETT